MYNINVLLSSSDILFVASYKGLHYFNLANIDRGIYIPVENAPDPIAVDYDLANRFVYWADRTLSKICRARLDGTGK